MTDIIETLTVNVAVNIPQLGPGGGQRPLGVSRARKLTRTTGTRFDYREAAQPLIQQIAQEWRDARDGRPNPNGRGSLTGLRTYCHLYKPEQAVAFFELVQHGNEEGVDRWSVDCIDELLAEIDKQDKVRTDAIVEKLVARLEKEFSEAQERRNAEQCAPGNCC